MEKPLSVIITELNNNIINEINKSSLPPVILEPIMRDIYNLVKANTQKQMENEAKAYAAALAKENENNSCSVTGDSDSSSDSGKED